MPVTVFKRLENVQKSACAHNSTQIQKAMLSRKNISGGIEISDLKLYDRARVTRAVQSCNKNKNIDQ